MTAKTLIQTLVNVATNVNLSKKVRREAFENLQKHFQESKIKVPAWMAEIEASLEVTRSGTVARPQSVIGAMVVTLLMEKNDRGFRKYSHEEIADLVKAKYPGAATSAKSVASTLRDLEPSIKAQVPPRKAKSDKVKPEALKIDVAAYEFEAETDEDEGGSDEE